MARAARGGGGGSGAGDVPCEDQRGSGAGEVPWVERRCSGAGEVPWVERRGGGGSGAVPCEVQRTGERAGDVAVDTEAGTCRGGASSRGGLDPTAVETFSLLNNPHQDSSAYFRPGKLSQVVFYIDNLYRLKNQP